MAMEVRHILYAPSLRSRMAKTLSKPKTAVWAFGLLDGFPAVEAAPGFILPTLLSALGYGLAWKLMMVI